MLFGESNSSNSTDIDESRLLPRFHDLGTRFSGYVQSAQTARRDKHKKHKWGHHHHNKKNKKQSSNDGSSIVKSLINEKTNSTKITQEKDSKKSNQDLKHRKKRSKSS